MKRLPTEDREWALDMAGFKRLSDDAPADITQLADDDNQNLFYKDEPYTAKKLHQRLIIIYFPKYAAYQKAVRREQVARAEKMIANGSLKKQRKNPNAPARFVNRIAVTEDGERQRYITSWTRIRLLRKKNMMVSMPSVQTCWMMM